MNGFETGYLHLSRFAPKVHVGARVHQKQVIAYSGTTGMSTGPHLHFAMKRGGGYINPLTQRFPRADPLPKSELERFHEATAHVASLLDAEMVAVRAGAAHSAR
jgi:murein DD-endopeptidase MepM/ murein hydrolase activator NlpD